MMARIVHLACARCGHPQMHVVESAENDEVVAETVRDSGDRTMAADDSLTSAEVRQRRLESLPRSMPVGGIITPV
jgi:hypothetical protein